MIISQLNDLALYIYQKGFPCFPLGKLREIYAERMFLALANQFWSFRTLNNTPFEIAWPSKDELTGDCTSNPLSMHAYLVFESGSRRTGVFMHKLALEQSTKCGLPIESMYETLATEILQGISTPTMQRDLVQSYHTGRRWYELSLLLGDAIVLCGSPFNDTYIPHNIPEIVETGDEKAYEVLKDALLAESSWIRPLCEQLKGVLKTFEKFYPPEVENFESFISAIYPDISKTIKLHNPVQIMFGELRQGRLGTSVESVMEALKHHDGSIHPDYQLIHRALIHIALFGASMEAKMAFDLSVLSEIIVRSFAYLHKVPEKSKAEYYVRQILDSCWI